VRKGGQRLGTPKPGVPVDPSWRAPGHPARATCEREPCSPAAPPHTKPAGFDGAAGDEDQDPVADEPELLLPDPDELLEWLHPLAIEDGADPAGGLGAADGVDVPDEPDEPEVPEEPEELVEDPAVDDSAALDPVVDELALVEAPATDMPTPKLRPKAPRATAAATSGLLRFMVDPPLRANLTHRTIRSARPGTSLATA
jgi:hypothetical protein